jgi:omega-amidase
MKEDLKITLLQTSLHWEDVDANLKMFSEKISLLKEETDIIILPEMFSTGFSMNAEKVAEMMGGKAFRWMKEKSQEKKCAVVGSLMISESGKYFNRLILMKPDETFEQYNKRHLFQLAHEEKTYTAGTEKLIVEYKGWKICPLVCYDLRFPVWSRRTKKEEYDLLIYVANWPERRVQAWSSLLVARAIENQCYVAGVNRIGADGNKIYHSGNSAVINFKGDLLSENFSGNESVQTISLSKKELEDFRNHFPFDKDADSFSIQV